MSAHLPSTQNEPTGLRGGKDESQSGRDIEGSNHVVLERRLGEIGASQHHASTPLTVFARHKVQRGKEEEFRDWVREITAWQRDNCVGYAGAEIVRPTSCCETNEHVSIFRYDNYENLQVWMDSEERKLMLEKAQVFEEEPIVMSYHSLEYWFVSQENDDGNKAPAHLRKPPSREKMATVTFLAIWAQSALLGPQIAKIPSLPAWFLNALTVFVIIVLTTYIIMPIVSKYILHWWLFPDPSKSWYCFPKTAKGTKSTNLDTTEKAGQTRHQPDDAKQVETRDVESGE